MNTTKDFALQLDREDPLSSFREHFIIPEAGGKKQVYFLGNSLGLQPKTAAGYIDTIMKDWASLGVESFFHAPEPWMHYHDLLVKTVSTVVGARTSEVVLMNQLTVNLHLLLVSFYRPAGKRFKIICEARAFPSDQYAFETHVLHHEFDPGKAVIEVKPREGEFILRTEDILDLIREHGEETALVLFGGINYYTGQRFDMEAITRAGHAVGAIVGFDLAHAAGNIPLHLHDWQVDFACWCTYKYLNSGPGAIGGAFVHEKHHDKNLPRFAGWWGYDIHNRFKMEKGFVPMPGAEGWQLSTPAIFLYAAHRAALEIIEAAGWEAIQQKREKLNGYLWSLLEELDRETGGRQIRVITPRDASARGSQVSMLMLRNGKEVYHALMKEGFIVDWREPDVIRFAPVPLYNTYTEAWSFVNRLGELLK
ncbi:MAG: kynureninase [Sphingobacteriales bacterium]|nr:kynureninase [Sphingobacteriales bacterium]